MKVIIAGSRNCTNELLVYMVIKAASFDITEVVSGKTRGVDTIGEKWAYKHNIPVKEFPADWDTPGKGAGPIRNKQMAEYADALIAILYPGSRGTTNMIKQAKEIGLEVFVHEIRSEKSLEDYT